MKSPFPYFGGKSRVANLVWSRFGDTKNYIEPFFGSGAVLLARPDWHGKVETVNDADCYVANFFRALQNAPEDVARFADYPVNEADLHARHNWLVNSQSSQEFRERMKSDPDYFDAKIAGWWVWGISQWIGSGWCVHPEWRGRTNAAAAARGVHALRREFKRPSIRADKDVRHVSQKIPYLKSDGCGVHRNHHGAPSHKLPILGNNGVGVHSSTRQARNLPRLGDYGTGVHSKKRSSNQTVACRPSLHSSSNGTGKAVVEKSGGIYEYFDLLADRLRRVRVCCGDWSRITGPAVTTCIGTTAVFLDPPYCQKERDATIYSVESDVSSSVREWAIANGDNPQLRIALCGYEGEHIMPDNWECVAWKANGGYGANGSGRGKSNSHRERIWFSPHCVKPAQIGLFEHSNENTPTAVLT